MNETSDPAIDDNLAALLHAAIVVHGLRVEPAWWGAALAHITVTAEAARFVEGFPLDDEIEPAPVFTP